MKIVDDFVKRVLAELPSAPSRIENKLCSSRIEEIRYIFFPENCQYGGVLQLRYKNRAFHCIFYVVNYKLCRHYAVTAEVPLVQAFRREGSWDDDFKRHIADSLRWTAQRQENPEEIPEICRHDPLDELLNALPPEVMKYDYQRYRGAMGNCRQSVIFEMRHDFEAKLFIGFSEEKMCWMLEFSIVRHDCRRGRLIDAIFDRGHTFCELYAEFIPEYKEQIIKHISDSLIWLYNIKTPGWQEPCPAGYKPEKLILRG